MILPLRGQQRSPPKRSYVRQNVGVMRTTLDTAFHEDSTVGERAGVRGICTTDILVRRAINPPGCPSIETRGWPPHPSPLPRNTPR